MNNSIPEKLLEIQQNYLKSIVSGQRQHAVECILAAIRQGIPLLDLYVEVFQTSLYKIGQLWEQNRITVAEEHLATAITQFVLAQTYIHLPQSEIHRGNMVLTGVQNELHQVGGNIIADVLESQGWDVHFLGTNMPQDGILKAIEDHEATLVGISTTMVFNIPATQKLIDSIRNQFTSDCPRILVGGAAFRFDSNLWKEVGADGYASNVKETVTLLLN